MGGKKARRVDASLSRRYISDDRIYVTVVFPPVRPLSHIYIYIHLMPLISNSKQSERTMALVSYAFRCTMNLLKTYEENPTLMVRNVEHNKYEIIAIRR